MAGLGYPVTLIWPAETAHLTCVVGQFERLETGEVEAWYESRRQLAESLALMLECERAALERRLAKGLERIRGCRNDDLERRLLARWEELIARHQVVLECQGLVGGVV